MIGPKAFFFRLITVLLAQGIQQYKAAAGFDDTDKGGFLPVIVEWSSA